MSSSAVLVFLGLPGPRFFGIFGVVSGVSGSSFAFACFSDFSVLWGLPYRFFRFSMPAVVSSSSYFFFFFELISKLLLQVWLLCSICWFLLRCMVFWLIRKCR